MNDRQEVMKGSAWMDGQERGKEGGLKKHRVT